MATCRTTCSALLIEENLLACLVLLVPVPDCSVRRTTTLVFPLSAPVKGVYIAQANYKRLWAQLRCIYVTMSDEPKNFAPSVGGRSTTPHGLYQNNWKLPPKFPIKMYKDLVDIFKRSFPDNGCSSGVALAPATNAVGVTLYVSRAKVPKAYWDEVVAAVRDFYQFSNKDDIDSCVAGFLDLQRKLHGEDDGDGVDGSSKGEPARAVVVHRLDARSRRVLLRTLIDQVRARKLRLRRFLRRCLML